MAFEAGNVVMLKSGGQPMTVVAASEEEAECIWIGEEGEFFRHAIPVAALQEAPNEDDEEDEDDEDESAEQEEEEEDKPKAGRAA
jgi:uncharacterized protein YodC (DUF2158 family)